VRTQRLHTPPQPASQGAKSTLLLVVLLMKAVADELTTQGQAEERDVGLRMATGGVVSSTASKAAADAARRQQRVRGAWQKDHFQVGDEVCPVIRDRPSAWRFDTVRSSLYDMRRQDSPARLARAAIGPEESHHATCSHLVHRRCDNGRLRGF
jgi:hypothetical protein